MVRWHLQIACFCPKNTDIAELKMVNIWHVFPVLFSHNAETVHYLSSQATRNKLHFWSLHICSFQFLKCEYLRLHFSVLCYRKWHKNVIFLFLVLLVGKKQSTSTLIDLLLHASIVTVNIRKQWLCTDWCHSIDHLHLLIKEQKYSI